MTDKRKITDFDAAKKRMGAQKKDKSLNGSGTRLGAAGADAYGQALRKQKGFGASTQGGIRWYHYLQLALLLGLVTWLMRACKI
jgi:hypothetical protein